MATNFDNNKKLNMVPLPYIGLFDLDVLYQTSDIELLYQILYRVNEIVESQNIIIDNFQKVLEWANEQIETYTKEQLQEWLDNGTISNIIMSLGKIIKYIDTTLEMINDETLVKNQYIHTLGYSAINDKGDSNFYITNEIPQNEYYLTLKNGLYARFINEKKAKAYGLGISTDDSTLLNNILKYQKEIIFNDSDYYFNINLNNDEYIFKCDNGIIHNIDSNYCFNNLNYDISNNIIFDNMMFKLANNGGAINFISPIFQNKYDYKLIFKNSKVEVLENYNGNIINLELCYNIEIRNNEFIGDKINSENSNGIAINILSCYNAIITENSIYYFKVGLQSNQKGRNTEGIYFNNNQLLHCVHCIDVLATQYKNLEFEITQNLFDQVHDKCIELQNCDSARIMDNWFGAFLLTSKFITLNSLTINNNFINICNNIFQFNFSNSNGIAIETIGNFDYNFLIITNNQFYNYYLGISLNNSKNNNITNNTFGSSVNGNKAIETDENSNANIIGNINQGAIIELKQNGGYNKNIIMTELDETIDPKDTNIINKTNKTMIVVMVVNSKDTSKSSPFNMSMVIKNKNYLVARGVSNIVQNVLTAIIPVNGTFRYTYNENNFQIISETKYYI